MKKVLSTVAALGLVAGVSASASALEWTIGGQYDVTGVYLNHAVGTGAEPRGGEYHSEEQNLDFVSPTDDINGDSYYYHMFRTDVTMKVNDSVSVTGELYLIDKYTVWGVQDDGGTTDGGNINLYKLYMDYISPVGMFRIGRTQSLSWMSSFNDDDFHGDRIMFMPGFLPQPFSTCFFVEKVAEFDGYDANDDEDLDVYFGHIMYQTEPVTAAFGLAWWNGATQTDGVDQLWLNNAVDGGAVDFYSGYMQYMLYAKVQVAMVKMEFEGHYFYGDWADFDPDIVNFADIDIDSWGLMFDVSAKFGNLDAGVMYFGASGQKDDMNNQDSNTNEAFMIQHATWGLGGKFQPLYILTGPEAGMLNEDMRINTMVNPAYQLGSSDYEMMMCGVHAVVAKADYQVTPDLGVHGAVGYAWADQTELYQVVQAGDDVGDDTHDRDDDYGWEINLGASYKLLENLTYDLHLGYLATGDFFAYDNTVAGGPYETDDPNDIWLVTHSLTMKF